LRQLAIPAALLTLVGTAAAFRQQQPGPEPAVVASPDSSDQEIVSFLIQANTDEITQARAALPTAQDPDVKRFAERMIKDHGEALSKAQSIARRLGVTVSESSVSRPDMAMPSHDTAMAPGDTSRMPRDSARPDSGGVNPNYHDSVAHRPDPAVPSNDSIRTPGDSAARSPEGRNPTDSVGGRPDMSVPSSDSAKAPNRAGIPNRDSAGMRAGAVNPDQVYMDAQVTAHQQVLEKLRGVKIKDKELKQHVTEVKKTVQAHLTEAKKIQSKLERTS
jgi:predicted outer membrane protein